MNRTTYFQVTKYFLAVRVNASEKLDNEKKEVILTLIINQG